MHAPNKELTLLGFVILTFFFTLEKRENFKQKINQMLQKNLAR